MARQRAIPGLGRLPQRAIPDAVLVPDDQGEGGSSLERTLLAQLRALGVVEPVREYRFRQYRVDFCWPMVRLCVEVEGGVWTMGRHVRPLGFIRDTRKYNALALSGFAVLRYAEGDLRSGRAAAEIAAAVATRAAGGGHSSTNNELRGR